MTAPSEPAARTRPRGGSPEPAGQAVRGGVRARLDDAAERLWPHHSSGPAGARRRGLLVAAFLVATLLPVLRLWRAAPLDAVWAEDGSIFVTQNAGRGFIASVLHPYAGYAHVVPRTLAALVELAPARFVAAGLTIGAALVVAALAVLLHEVLGGWVRHPGLRWVVPGYLVLLPVGRETVGNIANLHWYLLATSALVLFWTPGTRALRAVGAVVLLLTALSDPFTVLLVPVALVRLVLRRSATAWTFTTALVVGAVVQSAISATAPQRVFSPVLNPVRLGTWFVGRAVSGTFFGEWLTFAQGGSTSMVGIAAGIAGLGLVVLAVTRLRGTRGRRVRPFVQTLCAGGVGAYLAMVGLSGVATARYAVPSSILLVTAVVTAADAWIGRASDGAPLARLDVVAAVAVAGCLAFAVLSSFLAEGARPTTIRWSTALIAAAASCSGDGTTDVAVNPTGWSAVLPCHDVTSGTP